MQFCQTTQCRTRYILEHFGEEVDPDWRCDNCDACDAMQEAGEDNGTVARTGIAAMQV
ncbi:MAG: RecQ family zinc-binding domain-containing protein [Gemmatimonadaceae bacterium]